MARQKDFKGCFRCRARKIKCGGEIPSCIRCKKISRHCPGYSIELVWVQPNSIFSKAQGRRAFSASTTWYGWHNLKPEDLDEELLNLDTFGAREQKRPSFKDPRILFDVLDLRAARRGLQLSPNLDDVNSDWNDRSKYLFHHYVKYIAPQMIPLDGCSNPWATHYPLLANENNSVRYALLSQAAAHLWHLQGQPSDLEIQILRYRGAAIAHLRDSLSKESTSCSFDATLSTVLYLIMAEAYYGRLDGWRCHFSAAVDIALSNLTWSPWLRSDISWNAVQPVLILCLSTRIDDKRLVPDDGPLFDSSGLPLKIFSRHPFTSEVAGRKDFGNLFGMTYELANIFAECADAIAPWDENILAHQNRMEVEHLTQRLLGMSLEHPDIHDERRVASGNNEHLRSLHNHIFALGILICLQRRTINPPPSKLSKYTTLLFDGVEKFTNMAAHPLSPQECELIPCIWPVFHAAVELYNEEDQQHARRVWLDKLMKSAAGNRKHICAVVEKVWQVRRERANQQTGQALMTLNDNTAQGDFVVLWKDIANDMNMDLILV